MYYSSGPTACCAQAADAPLGNPFSAKIVRNHNANTVRKKVDPRTPQSAQSAPKKLPKWSPNLTNGLPRPLRRRLFAERVDLHKTCAGMDGLQVDPPREGSIFDPFAPKGCPEASLEHTRKKTL